MSMKGWERNTGGLAAHAQRRKEVTSQRVEAAITTLLRANTPINFTTVSKEWTPRRAATIPRENRASQQRQRRLFSDEAGVTKQYLYANEQIRGRIEALRDQQQQQVVRQRAARPHGKTDASKDIVILAKDRRIKELEEEVRRLKKELQGALGKLYERV